jgi:uncharacterized protein (DUF433 family)
MSVMVLDRELYTVSEAARLLRMPASTLRWWLDGRPAEGYPPVIRPEPTGSNAVTWGEYVEAGYLREYRQRKVSLQHLRPVIDRLREVFGVPYPLAHFKPFVGPGPRLVLEIEQELGLSADLRMVVDAGSGQLLLTKPAESFLERVEFATHGDQWAQRIYPAGKSSKVIIDPDFAFGAPTVEGIRTEVLAELVEAGEPIEDIASDFSIDVALVKQALVYEWATA